MGKSISVCFQGVTSFVVLIVARQSVATYVPADIFLAGKKMAAICTSAGKKK